MNRLVPKKIYILAGEASGDLHGANLIKHLRNISKEPLEIYGVGGDKMREIGVRDFYDLAHFHVTGLTDAVKKVPQYRRAAAVILSNIQKVKPDLVVLIDNPGFNLHMAKKIHALGIPIVYFIAPQVWAWAPKRVLKIKKYVKKVLVVFEFEKKFFEDHGVPVVWVGHPLKDLIDEQIRRTQNLEKRKGGIITLLPGSRIGELKMLFSIFLEAAKLIAKKIPDVSFEVVQAPTMPLSVYKKFLDASALPIRLVADNGYAVIQNSDLAIACSGTVTLECALLGTPVIIANRGTLLTYLMAKTVLRVDCLGLPNLILGQKKFPEFLQYNATPKKIADEAIRILNDEKTYQQMKEDCLEVSKRLGPTGASRRAANEILALLTPRIIT